jgi:hypothetical protein
LRAAGALGGLTPVKRGPKPALRNPMAAELAQAKRSGDVANRRRQREDDVEVGNREQFSASPSRRFSADRSAKMHVIACATSKALS